MMNNSEAVVTPALINADSMDFVLAHSDGGGNIAKTAKVLTEMGGMQKVRQYNMKGMGTTTASEDLGKLMKLGDVLRFEGHTQPISHDDLNALDSDIAVELDLLRAFGAQAPQMAATLKQMTKEAGIAMAAGDPKAMDAITELMELVTNLADVKKIEKISNTLNADNPAHADLIATLGEALAPLTQALGEKTLKMMDMGTLPPAFLPAIETSIARIAAQPHIAKDPALSRAITQIATRIETRRNPEKSLGQSIEAVSLMLGALIAEDGTPPEVKEQAQALLDSLENLPKGEPLSFDQMKQVQAIMGEISAMEPSIIANIAESVKEQLQNTGNEDGTAPAPIADIDSLAVIQDSLTNLLDANTVVKAKIHDVPVAQMAAIETTLFKMDELKTSLMDAIESPEIAGADTPVNETTVAEITKQIEALTLSIETLDTKPASMESLLAVEKLRESLASSDGVSALAAVLALDSHDTGILQMAAVDLVQDLSALRPAQIQMTAKALDMSPAQVTEVLGTMVQLDAMKGALEALSQENPQSIEVIAEALGIPASTLAEIKNDTSGAAPLIQDKIEQAIEALAANPKSLDAALAVEALQGELGTLKNNPDVPEALKESLATLGENLSEQLSTTQDIQIQTLAETLNISPAEAVAMVALIQDNQAMMQEGITPEDGPQIEQLKEAVEAVIANPDAPEALQKLQELQGELKEPLAAAAEAKAEQAAAEVVSETADIVEAAQGEPQTPQAPETTEGVTNPTDPVAETIDPETGEPIEVAAEAIDPETGEPIEVAAEAIDPETGEPIEVAAEAIDPETGQPIEVAAEAIDPETGQPIEVTAEAIDPETADINAPEGVESPTEPTAEAFDPETGEPIEAVTETSTLDASEVNGPEGAEAPADPEAATAEGSTEPANETPTEPDGIEASTPESGATESTAETVVPEGMEAPSATETTEAKAPTNETPAETAAESVAPETAQAETEAPAEAAPSDSAADAPAEQAPEEPTQQAADTPETAAADDTVTADNNANDEPQNDKPETPCTGGPNCPHCAKEFEKAANNGSPEAVVTIEADLPSYMEAQADGSIKIEAVDAEGVTEERVYDREDMQRDAEAQERVDEALERDGFIAEDNPAEEQALHQALEPNNDYTQPQNQGHDTGNDTTYAPNDNTVNLTEEFHKCGPDCYHNQSVHVLKEASEATTSFGSASQEYTEMSFDDLDFADTPVTTSYETPKESPFSGSNDNKEPHAHGPDAHPICDGLCGQCKKCFTDVAGDTLIDAETDALVARLRAEAGMDQSKPATPEANPQTPQQPKKQKAHKMK